MSEFFSGTGGALLEQIIKSFCSNNQPAELIEQFNNECQSISEEDVSKVLNKLAGEGVNFNNNDLVINFYHTVVTAKISAHNIFQYPPGHPVRTYLEENQLIRELLSQINQIDPVENSAEFSAVFDKIRTVEKHYVRKENQLFPCLERHGWDSPSKNMWALHDEIREKIKAVYNALQDNKLSELAAKADAMQQQMLHLMAVEEQRLLPNAMGMLDEQEWVDMRIGDDEIGWMLDETPPIYPEPSPADDAEQKIDEEEQTQETTSHQTAKDDRTASIRASKRGNLHIDTTDMFHYDEGYLTPEQVNMMLKVLPLDITYVDEHDRVVFYNRGDERIFPRSANVIGREVRYCHPPKSVDAVLRILEEFRRGSKDVADFRIYAKGRYLLIRYFAVRDNDGTYRGVIEMSQDITDITNLEGEQRLLDWD